VSSLASQRGSSLVFDLDGTIIDPSVGVGRSINHALAAFGFPPIKADSVSQYIGPPLDEIFRHILPTASDSEILWIIEKYRERYRDVGCSESVVYPGIPEALMSLAAQGYAMGVCTSKRVDFAERVLVEFGLRAYFDFVKGGDVGIRKENQLRELCEERALGPGSTMIGDRAIDVTAARANGFFSVGVLWGHGSREELVAAGADCILQSPYELATI